MICIRRATIALTGIWLLITWGCSKAPLPTAGNNDQHEVSEILGRIYIAATGDQGAAVDSARVYWDGSFIGYTPLAKDQITPGIHALRIQKYGFEIYVQSVNIASEQPVYIEALLRKLPSNKGQLLVTVDQDSAMTLLTDQSNHVIDLFYTRERVCVLDPGGYFLKSEKSGFRMVYLALEIKADSTLVKNIRLEKISQLELPEIVLSLPDSGQVNRPILISWDSKRADRVDIDYVVNPGLSGRREINFTTSGMRYIRAKAYNQAGIATAIDSVLILEPRLQPDVPPDLQLNVTPDSAEYDQPVQVTWNSNGSQVIIDQGIGVRGPSGTEEVVFATPGLKIFTAVAYGEKGTTTTKRDTILVKDPGQPKLPIIFFATIDSVQVGMPATFEWHSQNASRVDIDYVPNPGLNGKAEVIFQSAGTRIITATAYNQAGQTMATDTLEVVLVPVQKPQALPLYIEVNTKVAAIHPTVPQVLSNLGPVEIKLQGHYRITAMVWYDSGDYQKNESFFIVVHDDFQRSIFPVDPNAGCYKVIPDDPGSAHVTLRDAGLYYLTPGNHTIDIQHYYTICNQYPQFVVNGPIQDAESVQIIYLKLEYVQP